MTIKNLKLIISCSALLFSICLSISIPADDTEKSAEKEGFLFDAYVKLQPKSERTISKAQKWLAETQHPDGSWNTSYGRNNIGVISFAVLALMVDGNVPGEGQYAEEIGKGIQFILNSQRESGLISGPEGTKAPMYQHALATLLLVEAYGMTKNPRIREAVLSAVDLIVETQGPKGGWRYQPKIEKGDISATVMQVMALRAAVEAGIYVPDQTIENAVEFIKSCYNKKEKGFGYMHGNQKAEFARTAAGTVSLQTVGLHDDPIIKNLVKFLMEHGFEKDVNHYWYGHYYASVALYHYGGAQWKKYYPKITEKIINDLKEKDHYNKVLTTAWAVMIMGVPYRYLPIYQR